MTRSAQWLLGSVLVFSPASGAATGAGHGAPPDPVVIGERLTIRSEILDEARTILVHVPPRYHGSGAAHPVLYLLDGEYHFNHVAGIVDFLSMWESIPQVGHIPPMIVVGVVNTDRPRDMRPQVENPGRFDSYLPSGSSARFLRFLNEELVPQVDRSYRTLPLRLLAGHCGTGLFTLHAFLAAPLSFDGYIAITPHLIFDEALPLSYVPGVLSRNAELESSLFFTVGRESEAWIVAVERLAAILDGFAPPGLRWSFQRYNDSGHGADVHLGIYHALQWFFDGWRISEGALKQGQAAVDAHYTTLSKRFGFTVQIPEPVLNSLGYQLLERGNVDEAIAVLRRNTEAHPTSWNAFDSLGEAYAAAGRIGLAITSYERSIELNPENRSGIAILKELRSR